MCWKPGKCGFTVTLYFLKRSDVKGVNCPTADHVDIKERIFGLKNPGLCQTLHINWNKQIQVWRIVLLLVVEVFNIDINTASCIFNVKR